MNFVELVETARDECAVAGQRVTDLQNPLPREIERLKRWVNLVWVEIQNAHPDWLFLRRDFTLPVVAAAATYAAGQTSPSVGGAVREWDVSSFTIMRDDQGEQSEHPLIFRDYEDFRASFETGPATSGPPTFFTVLPDARIRLWPTPDAAYTITGSYRSRSTQLSANSDSPSMPADYHMLIVYGVMQKYGRREAAGEVYQDGLAQYRRVLGELEVDQLPAIEMGSLFE